MSKAEYYEEAFMIAMEEAGCWHLVERMTKEQRAEVGAGIAGSVEHEGLAFYTPPASDRYRQIEREWQAKYNRLANEYERYQDSAEKHVKRILRVWPDVSISIDSDGIYRHDGRTEQIA